jgi:RND family efflux transporter MFP subunit
MTTRFFVNCALWLCLCWLGIACAKSQALSTAASQKTELRKVQVVPAKALAMERKVRVTGSLAALDRTTLASKVIGRLETVPVDLGSKVSRGEVVAQIERRDYDLRVQQAAAALAQARTALGLPPDGANDTVEIDSISLVREARAVFEEAVRNRDRTTELAEAKIASSAQLDTAVASFGVASNRMVKAFEEARTRQATLVQRRVELEIALQQLADATIVAPFDSTIEARLLSVGEYVNAGTPLITVVRDGMLRLRLEVPEREASGIRLGQKVRFHAEGDTNLFIVSITRVSPSISEQNRMLAVEADVPGDRHLRPGAFARADLIVAEDDAGLAVPPAAMIQFAGLEKVVVVRSGMAKEIIVSTGRRGQDWVEISSGLQAGELVVLNPGNLRTGDKVAVAGSAADEQAHVISR